MMWIVIPISAAANNHMGTTLSFAAVVSMPIATFDPSYQSCTEVELLTLPFVFDEWHSTYITLTMPCKMEQNWYDELIGLAVAYHIQKGSTKLKRANRLIVNGK